MGLRLPPSRSAGEALIALPTAAPVRGPSRADRLHRQRHPGVDLGFGVPLGAGDWSLVSKSEYASNVIAMFQVAGRTAPRSRSSPDDEYGRSTSTRWPARSTIG